MKTPKIYIGALTVFCIAALIIGSSGAAAMLQKGTVKSPMTGQPDGERMLQVLDNLTAQGYDVSSVRTAVTAGDYETSRTLMEEFRTANPDAFPACGKGAGSGHPGGQWRAGTTGNPSNL